jgi:hypothetical protein
VQKVSDCLFVVFGAVRDLLLCAKHLFFSAKACLTAEARERLERRCEALRLKLRLVKAGLPADEALRLQECSGAAGACWRGARRVSGGALAALGSVRCRPVVRGVGRPVCESGGGLLRQVRRAAASVQRCRWATMAMGGA